MLREPTFPAGEFDVLKRQVRDSLEQGRTDPQALAFRTLQRKLSPHPKDDVRYMPTVDESLERLEAVTVDQVRKLYEDQLGGAAGEFVAVGDFDAAPALQRIDETLKGWQAKTPYKRIDRPFVPGVKGEQCRDRDAGQSERRLRGRTDIPDERRRPGRSGLGSGRLPVRQRHFIVAAGRARAAEGRLVLRRPFGSLARIRWTSRRNSRSWRSAIPRISTR